MDFYMIDTKTITWVKVDQPNLMLYRAFVMYDDRGTTPIGIGLYLRRD